MTLLTFDTDSRLFECFPSVLQKDLTNVSKWSTDWQLTLNTQKCFSFSITLKRSPVPYAYHINNSPLQHVADVRNLGIMLDSKLTFSAHINSIVKKANKALALLFRSFKNGLPRQKLDRKPLIAAYCANVRSILDYGSVLWSGAAKTHLNRLERIQHKFLSWLAARTRGTDRPASLQYLPAYSTAICWNSLAPHPSKRGELSSIYCT